VTQFYFQCAYAEFCNFIAYQTGHLHNREDAKKEGDNESKRESDHISKKRKKTDKKKKKYNDTDA
jgi:hypothetical protein